MKTERSITIIFEGDSSVGIPDASILLTFDPPMEFDDGDSDYREQTRKSFESNPYFEDGLVRWTSDLEEEIKAENEYYEQLGKEAKE